MSRRGFALPNSDPTSCFSCRVKLNRFIETSVSLMGETFVHTTRPPFAHRPMIDSTNLPSPTPMVEMTLSAITPQVSSCTRGIASSIEAAVWVAPKTCACSRLNSTGSTAITCRAPDNVAPCTAFMPTPPQPMTTTDSPCMTPAAYTAEPQPVVTPQPTSAALSSGMSGSILMHDDSAQTVYSPNVPMQHIKPRSLPWAWWREVKSVTCRPASRYAPRSHRFCLPRAQKAQRPHDGMNPSTT